MATPGMPPDSRNPKARAAGVVVAALVLACGASAPPDPCADGSCKAPDPCLGVTCPASDACHVGGACAAGACAPELPKSCPSGERCDAADGICKPANLCARVTCAASDKCHLAPLCDPLSGKCAAGTETPKSCPAGQGCDLADGACKDLCAAVSCSASDKCHVASCDTATGTCSQASKSCPSVLTCDLADGACKFPDLCSVVTCAASDKCHLAGTCDVVTQQCTAQTPKSCPSGEQCDPADGTCKTIDLCAAVTCSASDRCHVAGTCDPSTGICSAQSATICPSGQACDPADGACKAIDLCTGVVCAATDLCHLAGACDPLTGHCPAQAPKTCPSGETCDLATGACTGPLVPRPQVAKVLGLTAFNGIAVGRDGASYVGGTILAGTKTFDGIPVVAVGTNFFLARYDPASRGAVWAKAFGDASGQAGTDVAVTQDGTVAAIGTFQGNMNFGGSIAISTSSPAGIDFLAALDGATGSGRWAKKFDDGSGGQLTAIAANPGLNSIAVCGYANQAAIDLVPGATYGGGAKDIVIGVFNSAGTLQWSKQIGGPKEEECDSLAIDDAGDVYAAGNYNGPLSITASALPNPGGSNVFWLWAAKFNGSSGAALAQASFGSGPGVKKPLGLAIDPNGKLFMAGSFTAVLPFGATSLQSAGGSDAFVARLDPAAAFAPLWAVRLGGPLGDQAHGIAVDSSGDATAIGTFRGTTTGAAVLSIAGPIGSSETDAFVLQLSGATGQTQFAAAYGGVNSLQQDHRIAINRQGTAFKDLPIYGGGLFGTVDFGAPAGTVSSPSDTQAFLVFASFLP